MRGSSAPWYILSPDGQFVWPMCPLCLLHVVPQLLLPGTRGGGSGGGWVAVGNTRKQRDTTEKHMLPATVRDVSKRSLQLYPPCSVLLILSLSLQLPQALGLITQRMNMRH